MSSRELASTEADQCCCHPRVFFSRYINSGELFARDAYKNGDQEERFVIERGYVENDNAKGSDNTFFPANEAPAQGGIELCCQWRAATDAENKRYKNKSDLRTINGG